MRDAIKDKLMKFDKEAIVDTLCAWHPVLSSFFLDEVRRNERRLKLDRLHQRRDSAYKDLMKILDSKGSGSQRRQKALILELEIEKIDAAVHKIYAAANREYEEWKKNDEEKKNETEETAALVAL
ncbi:MAG TPA: hypothetical protein VI756_25960 [Blastocatellia bacterium]